MRQLCVYTIFLIQRFKLKGFYLIIVLFIALKNDDEIRADDLGSEHTPALFGVGVHDGGALFLHAESGDGFDFVFLHNKPSFF